MDRVRTTARGYRDLQIRTCTEFAGSGETVSAKSVYCPKQGHSVSVEECRACVDAEALFIGRDHDLLRCRAAIRNGRERATRRAAAHRAPVSSIMTTDVVCVRADVSIESATELLLERGFGALPVVDEERRPIGLVTKTDLVRHHRFDGGGVDSNEFDDATDANDVQLEPGYHAALLAGGNVAEVMTPVALTVPEEASISAAAAVMVAREIHHLPVVDHLGCVVGILSTLDIVDWVAQGKPRMLIKRGRVYGA